MGTTKLTVDSYFELLKHLSDENKVELISRLKKSIKKVESKHKKTAADFSGKWLSDKTAEEIIDEIYSSRVFNRQLEEL